MIDLYSWMTPNGFKVPILLHELDVPYTLKPVNLNQNEQKTEDFKALNPNQSIPVIVDHAPLKGPKPLTLFESGAILSYLAEKYGSFFPKSGQERALTQQWLAFEQAQISPTFTNAFYFKKVGSEKLPHSFKRFMNETHRLCRLLNQHFEDHTFLTQRISIADIALYPWVRSLELLEVPLSDYLHLKRWYHTLDAREGVQKGMACFKQEKTEKATPTLKHQASK